MTLLNAEPAEAILARTWPTARGVASQSLLRAGIAFAAAGLLLVLICGLAYADASASLPVNVVPSGSPPTAKFVANFNDVHQTIDGFGSSDAYQGNVDTKALDALYCINATDPGCGAPGIGLTLLREGMDSTDGITQSDTVPIGTPGAIPSQTVAMGAKARGAILFATPWKVSNSNLSAAANGIIAWVDSQIAVGLTPYAVTTGNEVDCCSSFPFFPADTVSFIKILGPMLHSRGIKLSSPELEDASNLQTYSGGTGYIPTIEADSTANAQVDIFATHQYGCGFSHIQTCMTLDGTRHWWEDEVSNFAGPDDHTIVNALQAMGWMYDAIVVTGFNAWNYWQLLCGCNAGLVGDVTNLSTMSKRYFAVGNWSRFVRPGWVRIGVSGSQSGLYGVAAFKDPATDKFAIIAINNSGADIPNVTFAIQNAAINGSVSTYVTSSTPIGNLGTDGNLSAGSSASGVPSSLVPNGGVFTSTVPYGVTTFVGTAH